MPRLKGFCQLGFNIEVQNIIASADSINKSRNYKCCCGAWTQAVFIGGKYQPITHIPLFEGHEI